MRRNASARVLLAFSGADRCCGCGPQLTPGPRMCHRYVAACLTQPPADVQMRRPAYLQTPYRRPGSANKQPPPRSPASAPPAPTTGRTPQCPQRLDRAPPTTPTFPIRRKKSPRPKSCLPPIPPRPQCWPRASATDTAQDNIELRGAGGRGLFFRRTRNPLATFMGQEERRQ